MYWLAETFDVTEHQETEILHNTTSIEKMQFPAILFHGNFFSKQETWKKYTNSFLKKLYTSKYNCPHEIK